MQAHKDYVDLEDSRWSKIEELEEKIRELTDSEQTLTPDKQEEVKKLKEEKTAAHAYVATCQ